MVKVSVIVPVYNGELFLREAIKSIQNQTMHDIEIILINDKSTDSSGEICDELQTEDQRIKVIHLKENLGICGARNTGLRIAKGKYVAFCDNDDLFLENLIKDNYRLAEEHNADMVKFGRKLIDVDVDGNVLREKVTPMKSIGTYNQQTKFDCYFSIKSKGLLMNVWNGLYKLSVIKEKGIWFNDFMRYGSEDADFSYRFFMVSDIIIVNPNYYYIHYRRNEFSTSRKFNKNKLESMMLAAESEAIIFNQMIHTSEVNAKQIIEINKLIMNMYTQQIFHQNNPMSTKEKINYLYTIKAKKHLNYSLNKDVKSELKKIKIKHLPFSIAYNNNWMKLSYVILKLQHMMNNETW